MPEFLPKSADITFREGGVWRGFLGILVLFAIAVGVPVYEGMNDNWLGKEAGTITWDRFRSGALASETANSFADNSKLADELRPDYAGLLYLAFQRTNDKVTLGKTEDDGTQWLFSTRSIERFQRENTEEVIEEFAALVSRLDRALNKRGTRILFAPLPDKPTIHPEKLLRPAARDDIYEPLRKKLAERDVWTLDVMPAMDAAKYGNIFSPNNTHWTSESSERTARLLATELSNEFEGAVPGIPIKGSIRRDNERMLAGDLGKSLGFREGSKAESKILYPYRFTTGVSEDGKALRNFAKGQDIAVVGSSFSYSYNLVPMLCSILERQVEDLSAPGMGGIGALSLLLDEYFAGDRELPKVIVWEFPEKYLLFDSHLILPFLRQTTKALGDPTYYDWLPTKTAYEIGKKNHLDFTLEANGVIRGEPTGGDPHLYIRLPEPIEVNGDWALSYSVQCMVRTTTKVLFDFGSGLKRLDGCVATLPGGKRTTRIVIPVPAHRGRKVHGFRLDPVDARKSFILSDIDILRRP